MKTSKKIVQVQLVLGNPKLNCDGYGICKFSTKDNPLRSCCHPEQTIDAQIYMVNDFLYIHIQKEKIHQRLFQKYFSTGIFRIDTNIDIPLWLTRALGCTPSVLSRGLYKIREEKGGIIMYCPIYLFEKIAVEA